MGEREEEGKRAEEGEEGEGKRERNSTKLGGSDGNGGEEWEGGCVEREERTVMRGKEIEGRLAVGKEKGVKEGTGR